MSIYLKIDNRNTAALGITTPIPDKPKIKFISRIQVPEKFRGKGYGSRLLNICLDQADQNQYILYFQIPEKKFLKRTTKWLIKYGFFLVSNPDLMYRRPYGQLLGPPPEEIQEIIEYMEKE